VEVISDFRKLSEQIFKPLTVSVFAVILRVLFFLVDSWTPEYKGEGEHLQTKQIYSWSPSSS